ncbi:hypothetical protein ACIO3O_01650 [Streptomyces sp. NPDC087440]|uniref:hypothetical protein n=1 Tax=Streptomyces sp. NPDC087440 TaxID=3365790 RepID=UPI00382578A5
MLYEELRALEARAELARSGAGLPYSRRLVSQALSKPPYSRRFAGQRLSDWVPEEGRRRTVPRESDDLLALVRLWSAWAGEQPVERVWLNLLEEARRRPEPRSASTVPGRPIGQFTDPFAAGVQRAIDADPVDRELPILPLYVPREHDRLLAEVVEDVVQSPEGRPSRALRVLVGDSSTGKTRACWEAMGLLPQDWRLVHVLGPGFAQELIKALDGIVPRTVLWLGEIHWLARDGLGESAAARLREVLADAQRGPLLVLGTALSWEWQGMLRSPPEGDRRDPHAQARALLDGKYHRVPYRFDSSSLPELQRLAADDLRLQDALQRAEQGQIAQYLAGGPMLIQRFETDPALNVALMESAMDACRLGHDPLLPQPLLRAAVRHYLTAFQYETVTDADIANALTSLNERQRGTRGPLTRIRYDSSAAATTDKLRLADYLDQHGRRTRRTEAPPPGLWDDLAEHATRECLPDLAVAARERGHLRIAVRLLTAAVEAEVPGAFWKLCDLLDEEERFEEELLWCLPLAEADDSEAMDRVGDIMRRTGRPHEAVTWFKRAAEAGRTNTWFWAGMLLHRAGDLHEAETCLRRAADAGVRGASGLLADVLESLGRMAEAVDYSRKEAEAHGGCYVGSAAALMRRRGDSGAAVLSWLLRQVWKGDRKNKHSPIPWAMYACLQHVAQDAVLRAQLRSTVSLEGVDPEVRGWMADLLQGSEGITRGEREKTLICPAEQLRAEGRLEEALTRYEEQAASGQRDAMVHVAALHEQLGREKEAAEWARRGALAGDLPALRETARLMTAAEGPEAAFAWLRSADRLAEDDYTDQRYVVAALLHAAGRTEEAFTWLRDASRAGDAYAWYQYADLLALTGRTEEARRMRQYGWEPDGDISAPWRAEPAA